MNRSPARLSGLAAAVAVAVALLAACATDAPPDAEDDPPGVAYGFVPAYTRTYSPSSATSKCLDATGGSTAPGTEVQMFGCNSGANQAWSFPSGASGSILGDQSHLAVTGYGALYLYPPNEPLQSWTMSAMVIHTLGGKCIQIAASGTAWLAPCNAADAAQRWSYDVPSGHLQLADGRCLAAASLSTHAAVAAAGCGSLTTQAWVQSNHGSLQLGGGYCLDLPGGNTADHTALQLYPCGGGTNEAFSFNGALVQVPAGQCLQVPTGSVPDHTLPHTAACTGDSNQRWEYKW